MTVNINNQATPILENSTIEKLLEQLKVTSKGIAIAVNNEVISKEKWAQVILENSDNVMIIQATQGG